MPTETNKLTIQEKIIHELARCKAAAHAHSVIADMSAGPESVKHKDLEAEIKRFSLFLQGLLELIK